MENREISIKFCGGCNPRINRGQIAQEVRERLARSGYAVSYNRLDVDLVIYMSGCSADCARRYSTTQDRCVAVAGTAVDCMAAEEHELVNEIMNRVRDYFEELERGLSR